jgi:hypothetical protein
VVSPVKELETVCAGFLRFYWEVDSDIKAVGFSEPVAAMVKYARNPGHVVQTIRKTVSFLESEMISLKVAREVREMVVRTPPEIVGCLDKTMAGFILWDLIRHALEFYSIYFQFHYKIDIFSKTLPLNDHVPIRPTKSFPHSPERRPRPPKVQILTPSPPKFHHKKRSKKHHAVKSFDLSPVESKAYESLVTERFHEFLVDKLRTSPSEKSMMRTNKEELLTEFSRLMESMDRDAISGLLDESKCG